ncbi:MAG TPA: DUF2934 domain-containing protein [Roseiarcus sp.]
MSSIGSSQQTADTPAERHTASEPEPASPTTDRSERIREIAYYLWLDEGCPEGGAERHWTAAETVLESEAEQRKRIEGEPPGEPVSGSRMGPRARRAAAE